MNDRIVLTEADALADLAGTPRPDNPSVESLIWQRDRLRSALDRLAVAIQDTGDTWTPVMRAAFESVEDIDLSSRGKS